jgi:hypothetical protein
MNKGITFLCFLVLSLFISVGTSCGYATDQEVDERSKEKVVPPEASNFSFGDPQKVMASVASRYSDLEYYRSKGANERETIFDGELKSQSTIPFEIEYHRGLKTAISWRDASMDKIFKIENSKSWIEIDGGVDRRFENPREGLNVITLAEDGLSLFLIKVFVFRRELGMGDRFFIGLRNPRIEREAELDGHRCLLLAGDFESVEANMTYWIDAKSHLIRRIEREIVVRKTVGSKEYVNRTTTKETYTDIEVGP